VVQAQLLNDKLRAGNLPYTVVGESQQKLSTATEEALPPTLVQPVGRGSPAGFLFP